MKRLNKLASLLLAVSMVFSAVPAMAAEEVSNKDVIVNADNQGGSGNVPVTLNVGDKNNPDNPVLNFSVTVPTTLPVHVDGDGVVTVAGGANGPKIINRSSGPVKVEAIDVVSQGSWLLADWSANLLTEKVGTKKYALAIQGSSNLTTDVGVTVNSETSGTGDISTFEQIPGKGTSDGVSKAFAYNAHIAPQATDISTSIANVMFTIGWDEADIKGVDANVDKDNVTAPEKGEDEPEPIIYNDDGSITAKVGSVIPLGGFAYYSDEMPAIGWKSSNEDLATVDNDGNVTILDGSSGYEGANDEAYKVTITCYFKDANGNEDSTMESNNVVFHVWDSKQKVLPYLTFEEENGEPFAFQMSAKNWDSTLQYSTDAKNWIEYSDASGVINSVNGKLYLRGMNNTRFATDIYNKYSIIQFSPDKKIKCIGNINTLLDYKNPPTELTADYTFSYLFYGCTSLTQAPELPATKLTKYCYSNMFNGCTSLTQIPDLPATTLAENCYNRMFMRCSALTEATKLPVMELAKGCYAGMFNMCTSLTKAPELPATKMVPECYSGMFSGTSLTKAPKLPAKEIDNYCYSGMFSNCALLVQAPELPADKLAESCYERMFSRCTSLIAAPDLPATTLGIRCYSYMFQDCTALTKAPKIYAKNLSGGIYCCESMFLRCTSLVQAPALPATTLANYCYNYMFNSCTSLTQVPELPAKSLAEGCYKGMFYDCAKIKVSKTLTDEYSVFYRIPTSGGGTSATNAFASMFYMTGGTFTDNPDINTTYYLSNTNSIVSAT